MIKNVIIINIFYKILRLWLQVSEAIVACDQHLATEQKTKIELKQRENDLERKTKFIEYRSKLFTYDSLSKEWLYNYSDLRPWDPQTDMFQYESNFKIITKAKHNLIKLSNHCIVHTSPHNSLLNMHHMNRQHHHHLHHHHHATTVAHNLIQRNHHQIVAEVVETNRCIAPNESYDLFVQYNDIKQRLEHIEDNLNKINKKIDTNLSLITNRIESIEQKQSTTTTNTNTHSTNIKYNQSLYDYLNNRNSNTTNNNNNNNKSNAHLSQLLTRNHLLIALLAWLFGLISVIISQKIFKK